MGKSRKKRNSHKQAQKIKFFNQLENNQQAMTHGPQKKNWSVHDLTQIRPMTDNQHHMMQSFFAGSHIVAIGSPGTGKTFISLWLALNEFLNNRSTYDQIVIVRSAVASRDLGFLPGTLEEKTAVLELPYQQIFEELLGRKSSYEDMKSVGIVKFVTSSYMRGITMDRSIIILDEIQNMTIHEISTVMTRVGQHSIILGVGDGAQNDLTKKNDISGFSQFLKIASNMSEFAITEFGHDDIVRSEFVKSWIVAMENTK